MVSMKNLTVKELADIAKRLSESNTEIIATLVTTSEYKQNEGDKVVSQALVFHKEVRC